MYCPIYISLIAVKLNNTITFHPTKPGYIAELLDFLSIQELLSAILDLYLMKKICAFLFDVQLSLRYCKNCISRLIINVE
jgi:hypothetical protein